MFYRVTELEQAVEKKNMGMSMGVGMEMGMEVAGGNDDNDDDDGKGKYTTNGLQGSTLGLGEGMDNVGERGVATTTTIETTTTTTIATTGQLTTILQQSPPPPPQSPQEPSLQNQVGLSNHPNNQRNREARSHNDTNNSSGKSNNTIDHLLTGRRRHSDVIPPLKVRPLCKKSTNRIIIYK